MIHVKCHGKCRPTLPNPIKPMLITSSLFALHLGLDEDGVHRFLAKLFELKDVRGLEDLLSG